MAKKQSEKKPARESKSEKSMLAMAQERVFGAVQELEDIMAALSTFANLGREMFYPDSGDQKLFFEGLSMMRQALRNKHGDTIAMCLPMMGVGGDAAKIFSRNQFRKYFGDSTNSVTRFLNKYGTVMSWDSIDAKNLRAEADELLAEHAMTDTAVKRKLVIKHPDMGKKPEARPPYDSGSPPGKKTKKRPAILVSIRSMLDEIHPRQAEEPVPEPEVAPWPDNLDDDDF